MRSVKYCITSGRHAPRYWLWLYLFACKLSQIPGLIVLLSPVIFLTSLQRSPFVRNDFGNFWGEDGKKLLSESNQDQRKLVKEPSFEFLVSRRRKTFVLFSSQNLRFIPLDRYLLIKIDHHDVIAAVLVHCQYCADTQI